MGDEGERSSSPCGLKGAALALTCAALMISFDVAFLREHFPMQRDGLGRPASLSESCFVAAVAVLIGLFAFLPVARVFGFLVPRDDRSGAPTAPESVSKEKGDSGLWLWNVPCRHPGDGNDAAGDEDTHALLALLLSCLAAVALSVAWIVIVAPTTTMMGRAFLEKYLQKRAAERLSFYASSFLCIAATVACWWRVPYGGGPVGIALVAMSAAVLTASLLVLLAETACAARRRLAARSS